MSKKHPGYTRKFLNDKYNYLYTEMQEILEKFNPCRIHKESSINPETFFKHSPEPAIFTLKCNGYASGRKNLCCEGFSAEPVCKHVGPNGCKIKSLRCSTWVCQQCHFPVVDKVTFWILGPTDGHPNTTRCMGYSICPIISTDHAKVIDEMTKYGFHLYFRATKAKTIELSYQYFKKYGKNALPDVNINGVNELKREIDEIPPQKYHVRKMF